jgi:hypothetical protein
MNETNLLHTWYEEERASIDHFSTNFPLPEGWLAAFQKSLDENRDAERLRRQFLPKCNVPALTQFVMLVLNADLEQALNGITQKRGERLKTKLRSEARGEQRRSSKSGALRGYQELLHRAERAFETSRQGLADYCFGVLVVREYLHFRSGLKPTPRELVALLKAGLAASGSRWRLYPGQTEDYDLLRRNLKNFEKRHPLRCKLAAGEHSARIIEARFFKSDRDKY